MKAKARHLNLAEASASFFKSKKMSNKCSIYEVRMRRRLREQQIYRYLLADVCQYKISSLDQCRK